MLSPTAIEQCGTQHREKGGRETGGKLETDRRLSLPRSSGFAWSPEHLLMGAKHSITTENKRRSELQYRSQRHKKTNRVFRQHDVKYK